jgi:hypothetical protein
MVNKNVRIPKSTISRWNKARQVESNESTASEDMGIHEGDDINVDNNIEMQDNEYNVENDELFSGLHSNYSTENQTEENDDETSEFELNDYVNNEKWKSPLYNGSSVNLLHAIIMLAIFDARYSLKNDGFKNLLNILGLLLPKDSQLPPTNFLFKKFLPKSNIKTKYFCPSCHEPIMEDNKVFKCPCSGVEEHTKSDLVLNGCFYLYTGHEIFNWIASIETYIAAWKNNNRCIVSFCLV